MKIVCTPLLIILVSTLSAACTSKQDEQASEIAELRTELEQLTNAFGRLEFRVAQLEDQLAAGTAGVDSKLPADSSPSPQIGARKPEKKPAEPNDKRYDLTPVE